jgi:YesN/AraC family two-component response regulator
MRTIKDLHKYSKNLHVLYVEDDDNLRQETETLFKMLFKQIDTAEDGQLGLEKYNNNLYDLVISDVNMPNMNGVQMCQKIKEINPEQKVSIISAHDESNILMDLIKVGADGFILKPMKMDDVVTALYPVCRDAYTQIVNLELIEELNEKNTLLEKQNVELRTQSNAVKAKHQQLGQMMQGSKKTSTEASSEPALPVQQEAAAEASPPIKSSPTASQENAVLDEYFKADEDEGEENVLLLHDHAGDLAEMFVEIPEIISRYDDDLSVSEVSRISSLIERASAIFLYYSPYLDTLASSFNELSNCLNQNQETFLEILRIDPQSMLMLFDAVSADIERYVVRFQHESLAMKNAHHIHEPTALSIQQIITLIVPPAEDEGDIEFF